MEKEKILNSIIKDILKAPIEDDIFKFEKGKLYIGERQLPEIEVKQLMGEALFIKDSYLFKLLINQLKQVGREIMAEQSTEWNDVHFGKACLYVADLLNRKMQNFLKVDIVIEDPVKIKSKRK